MNTSTVWSCLCPDLQLQCWSVTSHTALKTISLCGVLSSLNLTVSDYPPWNQFTALQWIPPSRLCLLSARGCLLHIGLSQSVHARTTRVHPQLFHLHPDCRSTEAAFHLITRSVHGEPRHIYTLGPGYCHPLSQVLNIRPQTKSNRCASPHLIQLFFDEYLFPTV
ncbi:hypothetical protein D915_010315 [Fasciola hepatica]|uniref:Uncharacterized protein n=1 Tax=Fasciola hepatica TaxID=6192 RepID=A0A4E0R081_FASHE|nr:hypothetical protein D915_010315 [Fasciola hepatica]